MPRLNGPLVLIGAGSSIIVEFEETCRRLGVPIAAIVRNLPGACHALAADRVIDLDALTEEHRRMPAAIPLFTPAFRQGVFAQASRLGFAQFPPLVDPTAIVAASTSIGDGGYVNAGAILGGASRLGCFLFVNRGAQIGHHVQAGDFVSIGPGAVVAGHAELARGAAVGAGATILPRRKVGANSMLGAGAVLTQDLPSGCLAVGNPARIVRRGIAGYGGRAVEDPPP